MLPRGRSATMAKAAPLYDLTLLLSTSTEDDRRAKIVTDVEAAIAAAGGSVQRRDDWGTRPMTYQIDHQAEAEYHLLQFSGPSSLLESLSHTLRIDDGVLRFRIIKVLPGTPPAPDSPPPVLVATASAPAVAPIPEAEPDE
jgi:small subunit ribosomal protein S6